ncbi:MAG TPA: type II secretion system minor pseudopilin GspJ [Casimicrobiaceae bacterium]|nr:type II secretion system minor pseudopilin GspJ [Casimicrobiaceae bacterium]
MKPRRSGFTLIELMIALAILGLVAVFSYRALASLTDSEAQLSAEAQRWKELDGLFARLEADMREALPRDVRTGAGTEPAWLGDVDAAGNAVLRFSRAGPEFSAEPGRAGQRIGYRLRNAAIEVLYWPRLDQPATVTPQPYALAGGIAAFRVDYLDSIGGWRERWPSLGESAVPRAVRVGITLAGGEQIERWLVLR